MWVGGQRQAPAALPLGKNRYSFYRRLVGTQDVLPEYNEKISLLILNILYYIKFKNYIVFLRTSCTQIVTT